MQTLWSSDQFAVFFGRTWESNLAFCTCDVVCRRLSKKERLAAYAKEGRGMQTGTSQSVDDQTQADGLSHDPSVTKEQDGNPLDPFNLQVQSSLFHLQVL